MPLVEPIRNKLCNSSTKAYCWFWTFVLLHMVAWIVVPVLVCPNQPLDVIEGYAWGHEWLMGTYKHPPMQAWWLEILSIITKRADWAYLAASQIAVGICFWAVWQTGRRILGDFAALVGVMLMEGIVYYNFTSTEFNPNVLQLPFWALIGYSYYRAVRDNRLTDWALLGLWSAGGLYTKYSTALLLLALVILTLARPEARRHLKHIGPYLALSVAALLLAPHALWLIKHDFLPFAYAHGRMVQPADVNIVHSLIIAPMLFVGSQILAVLLGILLFIYLLESPSKDNPTPPFDLDKFDRAFLLTVSFGPCFLVLVMAIAFGFNIHDMWAAPFWNFLGIFAIARLGRDFSSSALLRFRFALPVVAVGTLLAFVGSAMFYPYITHKAQRYQFPGHTLTKWVTAPWHDRFHRPLTYVAGDTWPAGNIAFYTADRPHVFINMDSSISPWIDSADFKNKGGIVVWCIKSCGYAGKTEAPTPDYVTALLANNSKAELQKPLTIAKQTTADVPPAVVGWVIVPPENP